MEINVNYQTQTVTWYVVPALKDYGYFETGLAAWGCDPNTSRMILFRILNALFNVHPSSCAGDDCYFKCEIFGRSKTLRAIQLGLDVRDDHDLYREYYEEKRLKQE